MYSKIYILHLYRLVSTFARTPEKSLPTFKIALVICQEVYASSKYFPPLMAPKLDGMALVSALRQLDFQVKGLILSLFSSFMKIRFMECFFSYNK